MDKENKIRRLELAQALEEEFERLKDHPNFDAEKEKTEVDLTIRYLITGEHPKNYEDYDTLYYCIKDFEQMCNDYNIN